MSDDIDKLNNILKETESALDETDPNFKWNNPRNGFFVYRAGDKVVVPEPLYLTIDKKDKKHKGYISGATFIAVPPADVTVLGYDFDYGYLIEYNGGGRGEGEAPKGSLAFVTKSELESWENRYLDKIEQAKKRQQTIDNILGEDKNG